MHRKVWVINGLRRAKSNFSMWKCLPSNMLGAPSHDFYFNMLCIADETGDSPEMASRWHCRSDACGNWGQSSMRNPANTGPWVLQHGVNTWCLSRQNTSIIEGARNILQLVILVGERTMNNTILLVHILSSFNHGTWWSQFLILLKFDSLALTRRLEEYVGVRQS